MGVNINSSVDGSGCIEQSFRCKCGPVSEMLEGEGDGLGCRSGESSPKSVWPIPLALFRRASLSIFLTSQTTIK